MTPKPATPARRLSQLQLPTFNGSQVAAQLGISSQPGVTVFRTAPLVPGAFTPPPTLPVAADPPSSQTPPSNAVTTGAGPQPGAAVNNATTGAAANNITNTTTVPLGEQWQTERSLGDAFCVHCCIAVTALTVVALQPRQCGQLLHQLRGLDCVACASSYRPSRQQPCL